MNLQPIEQAYQESTKGTWEGDSNIYALGGEEIEFVCADANQKDAEFIALIHNELPNLLQYIRTLEEALAPAEKGGLHIRVDFTGCETRQSFLTAINAAANDLEIQKQISLSQLEHG